MTPEEIRRRRLANQHLLYPRLTDPADVVHELVAMQAQEYAMAKWAIALRMSGSSTDRQVEAVFEEGRILRTHVLRPTWHFVSPVDIRMVLQVTAARVNQANAYMYRSLGLDDAAFALFEGLLGPMLEGGQHLTRDEIRERTPAAVLGTDSLVLAHLLMHAELAWVICSGPRRGNQLTYALLEERVPAHPEMSTDEALAQLCRRYLATRGPATTRDLTTWSGLTVAQAKHGLALLDDAVRTVDVDGAAYHLMADQPEADQPEADASGGAMTFLLPDYDEYGMAYQDRSAIVRTDGPVEQLAWTRAVVVDGVVGGSWRRTVQGPRVLVELQLFDTEADDSRISAALARYAAFLGRELVVSGVTNRGRRAGAAPGSPRR